MASRGFMYEIRKAYASNRGLRSLTYMAVGLSAVGTFGMWAARERTIRDIRSENAYADTLKIFEGYKYGVEKVGKPLKYMKSNHYLNSKINFLYNEGKNSKMAIPVKGSHTYACLHSYASRPSPDARWQVDKVDIQMDGQMWTFFIHPSKQGALKPYQDMTLDDYEREVGVVMTQQASEHLGELESSVDNRFEGVASNMHDLRNLEFAEQSGKHPNTINS